MSLFTHNLIHLGLTLGGCALLLILLHLQERASGKYLAHQLGWNSVLVTGWLGVSLHELSHLIAARLFSHRIVSWKLFDPDPVSGTLGYVRHAYSRRNLWQILGNVFIALAPVLAGAGGLSAILAWMLSDAALALLLSRAIELTAFEGPAALATGLRDLLVHAVGAVWDSRTYWLPLQIYLAVCVASHMCPSRADLSGTLPGMLVLGVLILVGAALSAWLRMSLAGIESAMVGLLVVLMVAGLFQGGYVSLVWAASKLRKSKTRFSQRSA